MNRKSCFLFILYTLCCLSCMAQRHVLEDDFFKYDIIGKSVYIGFNEEIEYNDSLQSIHVVIPKDVTLEGKKYTVKGIKDYGFMNCTYMRTIDIPETIETLGDFSFYNCCNLERINIPGSVNSIQKGVFSGCNNLCSITVSSDNTTYDSRENCNAIISTEKNVIVAGCHTSKIPDSVKGIADYAFQKCGLLQELVIPRNIEEIGYRAFTDCYSLQSIRIAPGINLSLQPESFANCVSLNSLFIPTGSFSMPGAPFKGCENIESIIVDSSNRQIDSRNGCNAIIDSKSNTLVLGCYKTIIPEGVERIAAYAFSGCRRLTEMSIPASTTSVDCLAFQDCKSLVLVDVSPGNPIYYSYDNCLIEKKSDKVVWGGPTSIIPHGTKVIGEYAFQGMNTPQYLRIPETVERIERYAFDGCDQLRFLYIPSTTSLAPMSFNHCEQLTEVRIANGNQLLQKHTSQRKLPFAQCDKLKPMYIQVCNE